MKKTVFIISILCFMATMNVNAQKVSPKKATGISEKEMTVEHSTELSRVELRKAVRKAAADPDILTEKKGKETIFLRKSSDYTTGRQIYMRVIYIPETGEFVDYVEETPGNKGNIEMFKRSDPDKLDLGPERY